MSSHCQSRRAKLVQALRLRKREFSLPSTSWPPRSQDPVPPPEEVVLEEESGSESGSDDGKTQMESGQVGQQLNTPEEDATTYLEVCHSPEDATRVPKVTAPPKRLSFPRREIVNRLNTQDVVPDESPEQEESTQLSTQSTQPSTQPLTKSGPNFPKRKRTYAILPEAKELSVAEWYRDNEFLYNKKLRAHRDRDMRDRAMTKKAKEENVTVDVLGKWMEGMRTRYVKMIEMRSGSEARQLTERDAWIKEAFSFLRPHIVKCQNRKTKVYTAAAAQEETRVAAEEAVDKPLVDVAGPWPLQPADPSVTQASSSSRHRSKTGGSELEEQEAELEEQEAELYDKLRRGEKHLHELYEKWQVKQKADTPAQTSLKLFHHYVQNSLAELEPCLVDHYTTEVMRFTHAMRAHRRGSAPLPQIGPLQVLLSGPAQPHLPQTPNHHNGHYYRLHDLPS